MIQVHNNSISVQYGKRLLAVAAVHALQREREWTIDLEWGKSKINSVKVFFEKLKKNMKRKNPCTRKIPHSTPNPEENSATNCPRNTQSENKPSNVRMSLPYHEEGEGALKTAEHAKRQDRYVDIVPVERVEKRPKALRRQHQRLGTGGEQTERARENKGRRVRPMCAENLTMRVRVEEDQQLVKREQS